MRYIIASLLLLISLSSWAVGIIPDIVKQGDQSPIEQVVSDTLTFEEFAEWTAIRQRFEARANNEKERQIQCVIKGTNSKTCIDPHWCLYPDNLNKDECVWYRIKYDLYK